MTALNSSAVSGGVKEKPAAGYSIEIAEGGKSAISLHGYPRYSIDPFGKLVNKSDFDFWYNPTYDNYYKVLDAMHELGEKSSLGSIARNSPLICLHLLAYASVITD